MRSLIKNMLRKQVLRALLCGYLLIATVACTGGSTSSQHTQPTSTTTLQPEATSLPAGTVLFQANWAQGLSQWQASGAWKINQGQLEIENDSSDAATIIIPYRPAVANYALEVRMQVVRLPQEGGFYSIFATKQPGKDGYHADVYSLLGTEHRPFGEHPTVTVALDPPADSSVTYYNDYEPGFKWHTYRIEVRGNAVSLLDYGAQIAYSNSNVTNNLSNGPLGLSCGVVVLRVSSIRILSL